MSSTRIPSPARSQGVIGTPRQRRYRASRSVGSPARSITSVKLSNIVQEHRMGSFVLSPLRTRRSVLSDNTDIEIPRRKSWWKRLDESSKDAMKFLENGEQGQAINVEEFIDAEILSQEIKNYTIDLPESSDGESITSIVLPQRKLFKQKDQTQKVYKNIMDNRENLDQLQRSKINCDNTIHVGKKDLFNRGNKERRKPAFPAALLNISSNKTLMNKKDNDKDISKQGQMQRNLFGNRPGTKRKNMFAEFVVSESEDEISDIQAKVFGFAKNSEQNRLRASESERSRETSPTSDVTDIEIDDWKFLPSSTMVENQFGNLKQHFDTPVKKAKLSQLNEKAELDKTKVDIGNKSKQTNRSVVNSKNLSKDSKFSIRNVEDFFDPPLSERDEIEEDETLTEQNMIDNNRKVLAKNSQSLKVRDIETDKVIKDVTSNNNQVENYEQDMEIERSIKNVTTSNNKVGNDEQSIERDKSIKDVTTSNNNVDIDEQVMETEKFIKEVTTNSNNVDNDEQVMETVKSLKDGSSNNNELDNDKQDMEIDKSVKNLTKNIDELGKDEEDMEIDKSIKDVTTNNDEVDNDDDNNEFTLQYESDEGNNNPKNLNDENNTILKQLETTNNPNEKDESTLKDDTKSKYNMTDNKKRSMREAPNNNTLVSSPSEPIKEHSLIAINKLRPSLEPLRESTRLSDGTKGSSIERSGWDSHRITRKTLRQTFGRDFTPRKSLRALVMEKSAKRQTYGFDVTTKMPQACSTRLPENMHMDSMRDNDATNNDVIEPQRKSAVRGKENVKMSVTKTGNNQNKETDEEVFHNSNRKNTSKHSTDNNTQVGSPQTNVGVEKESDEQSRDFHVVEHFEETVEKFKHNYRNEGNDKGQKGFQDVLEKGINDERMKSLDIQKAQSNKEGRNSQGAHNEEVDEEIEDSQDIHEEESDGERKDSDHVQEEEIDEDGIESEDNQDDADSEEEIQDSLHNESEVRRDSLHNESEERRDSRNIQDSLNIDNIEEINEQIDAEEGKESDEESSASQNDENEESDEEMRNSEDDEHEESEKENIVSRNSEIDVSQPRYFMNHSTRESFSNMTEESDHEVSRMRRQNALEMYLQKVKQQSLEYKRQAEEATRNILKSQPREKFDDFKVPLRPIAGLRRSKPTAARPKPAKIAKSTLMGVGNLPPEILEDLKYKPPRRYRPSNASWITKRLYKFLETKLEPKYDYKARVRAEKLAETLYEFTKDVRRRKVAEPSAVDALKREMARLDIVTTHLEFNQFFHDFMPREIRIKVVPDIVNKIPLPKHGIFSNIIR